MNFPFRVVADPNVLVAAAITADSGRMQLTCPVGFRVVPKRCHTGAMHLDRYVDDIARQMAVAAAAGGPEAESLAERLVLPLRSAIRLALLDTLSAAADELTLELAPGSVEVRLRGGEPSFVIEGVAATEPASVPDSSPSHATAEDAIAAEIDAAMRTLTAQDVPPVAIAEEGGSARINLRMPDTLKSRVEAAALREGRSVNSWLVRAATVALEHPAPAAPRPHQTPTTPRRAPRRVTGWAQ